jgi:uncharacterized membrane protein
MLTFLAVPVVSLAPLLNAQPSIIMHAFAAIAAFGIGVVQLVAPKGTLPHRTLGYIWCALMFTAAASSFRIHGIDQWQGFSVIHLLSIMVLLQLPLALLAARRHNVRRHSYIMIAMFVGGLIIAGGFTFLPGRIMHAVVFGA